MDEVSLYYPASGAAHGYSAVALVYSLDGALVASGKDPSGSGVIKIRVAGLSSGVFLLRLEKVQGGQILVERIMKLAVLH